MLQTSPFLSTRCNDVGLSYLTAFNLNRRSQGAWVSFHSGNLYGFHAETYPTSRETSTHLVSPLDPLPLASKLARLVKVMSGMNINDSIYHSRGNDVHTSSAT